jgi:hypothetical protein
MKFQSHHPVMKTFLSGTVLTIVGLLGPFPAAGAEPDPCAVVTKAEVEKMIGELKEAPKPDTGLQKEKTCDYTTMSGSWLKVSLYTSERWGLQKGIVSEMNPTEITGLGEEAFSVKRGSTCEIYVRKGKLILEVSSTVGLESTRKFADAAIKQLP